MDRWRFTVEKIVTEGANAVIEATGEGSGPGTKTYRNTYSFHFDVRDGRIIALREYMDLLEAAAYMAS
jgi:ketosteroid isomerase-like protein